MAGGRVVIRFGWGLLCGTGGGWRVAELVLVLLALVGFGVILVGGGLASGGGGGGYNGPAPPGPKPPASPAPPPPIRR